MALIVFAIVIVLIICWAVLSTLFGDVTRSVVVASISDPADDITFGERRRAAVEREKVEETLRAMRRRRRR